MFPPQVFTSQFWEELVYPENKEKRDDGGIVPYLISFAIGKIIKNIKIENIKIKVNWIFPVFMLLL